jgi:NAD(P)-dependent dehydrogenase (short-subunit alcohol dehydrogenase family)
MLAVTGYRSKIVQELIPLLPEGEEVVRMDGEPPICNRYLLCAGVLRPKPIVEQSQEEIAETFRVNCAWPIQFCDNMLASNPEARICVIGSESGCAWSFDGAYAAAKAGLHLYVETKKLAPHQQLVCIAPSIISDAQMTLDRKDTENLERRRQEHRTKRFLKAVEVARLVHFLLYQDEGYISGTVIRVNGGPA